MRIGQIRSTEDALELGGVATDKQVRILTVLREAALKRSRLMMEIGELEKALEVATKAQFYREALESYKEGR